MLDNNTPIKIIDNYFPPEILEGLLAIIKETTNRKIIYNLQKPDIPKRVLQASKFASIDRNVPYNHAILKRYDRHDGMTASVAYERHKDPENLLTTPLFLCTLDGNADFKCWTAENKLVKGTTKPNRLILANENLDHQISMPTNESGLRYLLFLGLIKNLEAREI